MANIGVLSGALVDCNLVANACALAIVILALKIITFNVLLEMDKIPSRLCWCYLWHSGSHLNCVLTALRYLAILLVKTSPEISEMDLLLGGIDLF